jgi:hypothetical protein
MLLKVHRTLFYLGFFLAISTSHAASSSLDVHSYAIQVAPGIAAKTSRSADGSNSIRWPFRVKPLMIILVSTIGLSLIYFFRLRSRHRKERNRLFEEKSEALLALSKTTDQFYELTKSVVELKRELSEVKKTAPNDDAKVSSAIDELHDRQIIEDLKVNKVISEEQWTRFVNTFNKVYPNFILDIKAKCPDITFTEIRYLALSKLDLSTREIALLVGVSQDAIRQTRSRLNKKLGV